MNLITEHTNRYDALGTAPRTSGPHLRPLLEEIFGPVEASAGVLERRLLMARSAIAYLGVVLALVQVVVWLMIGLATAHLDSPWWLWTTGPAVAAVAALSLMQRWHRWWAQTDSEPEEGR